MPISRIFGVIRSNTDWADHDRRHQTRDRHRNRQPVDARDLVPHALGQQDVAGPAAAAPSAYSTPTGSTVPCHGWVSRTTPTPQGPATADAAPALAVRDRDAQRPEELQRARGAQRNAIERGHEQHA